MSAIIVFVSVIITLIRVNITLYVYKSNNYTLRVKFTLYVWKLHSACRNHTFHSEITLVRVFIIQKSDLYTQSVVLTRLSVIITSVSVIIIIILIRVNITLIRVNITLTRV
jgi:hypothetical protein